MNRTASGVGGRALVLVGHGSHLSESSSAPVYDHAARIRAAGIFDEVVEAFWKEEPSLRDALDLVDSPEVFVVPLFLAEGYFTRQVLPRELGIDGPLTIRGNQRVHYCRPVGTHPSMRELILRRARAGLAADGLAPDESALIIIGHGTPRSASSSATVYDLAEAVRGISEFRHVDCGFLDEPPFIADVVDALDRANIVLVPFFVAEGWHTAETIPEELALDGGETRRGGRTIRYTPPIGTLPEITDVVLALVRDAETSHMESAADGGTRRFPPGAAHPTRSDPISGTGIQSWTNARSKAEFARWLEGSGDAGRTFLQCHVRRTGDGKYSLTHVEDRQVPPGALQSVSVEDLTTLARSDDEGGYRPLRTADNLRRGWILGPTSATGIEAAVSRLYPATILHWSRMQRAVLENGRGADFPVVPFTAWAARQTGIYERLSDLDREEVRTTIRNCCGSCGRTRLWGFEAAIRMETPEAGSLHNFAATYDSNTALVPCFEPCTVFGHVARERLVEIAQAPDSQGSPSRK